MTQKLAHTTILATSVQKERDTMNKQPIDAEKLLDCLKKEANFCIKEKFNEKNTRFHLGRETVLTDIIR